MASPRGCFKTGCFGCLGLIALLLLITGIISMVAWNDAKKTDPKNEILTPLVAEDSTPSGAEAVDLRPGGVVTLDLSSGEFYIYAAEPDESLRVEAVYDDNLFDLEQEFSVLTDSTWTYDLHFRQTETGVRAFLQSVFSKGPSTKIKVYLPRGVPIELNADVSKGGFEGELGGLWLTSAAMKAHQGGFALEISEPLQEPMSSLVIHSNMGGFSANGLGNASPHSLEVVCKMGGADVRLDGPWQNDCDINLSVDMGGMSVNIPRDVKYIRGTAETPVLKDGEVEAGVPVLRIKTRSKRGEIDILQ